MSTKNCKTLLIKKGLKKLMEIFFAYFSANLLKLDTKWINGSPNRQNYNLYKPSSTQSE